MMQVRGEPVMGRDPIREDGAMTTILITGASSGLGAEMARQFADRGHDLALCARRTDRLEELRGEILAVHPDRRIELRAVDVTDEDSVFTGVRDFAATFGRLDRIVVNAGLGKGAPLGTGRSDANRQTAMTNFVGALTQLEAAMEVFRAQGGGHLVMVSSMSAMRGMPKTMTTYAATKAGAAHLVEGLRNEFHGKPGYDFTVLYPGYIASEMNEGVAAAQNKMMVPTEKGVAAMVAAIERKRASACVPPLPWAPLSVVMKHAPLPVLKRLL
jgi:short-subunit dehydrogenase